MVSDIRFPYDRDSTGDAETVDDFDFFEQIVTVSALVGIDESDVGAGEYNSPTQLSELEGFIAEEISTSPYIDGRPDVTVVASSLNQPTDPSLTIAVRARFEGDVTETTTNVTLA
jgi:hypothetical protein